MQPKSDNRSWQYRLMVIDGASEYFLGEGNRAAVRLALRAAETIANLPSRGSAPPVGSADDHDSGLGESEATIGVSGSPTATQVRAMQSNYPGLGDVVCLPDGQEMLCLGRGCGDKEWTD